jgi:hypothetical protein
MVLTGPIIARRVSWRAVPVRRLVASIGKGSEVEMKYLAFIWSQGRSAPEELAVMQRELPGYIEEMERRGVRLLGRELDLPETAALVRVRDGETLVSDGPFAETKELVAGIDLLDCADMDEAAEVMAKGPVTRFKAIEIRPFAGEPELSEQVPAFGRGEDDAGCPYLLAAWADGTAGTRAAPGEAGAWRRDVRARGSYVLGGPLGDAGMATTVRVRDGQTQLAPGPATGTETFVASIDVVRWAERGQAIELAATHPLARTHTIEVRPFYVG